MNFVWLIFPPFTADALDSESTSSGECYENIEPEMENLLNPGPGPDPGFFYCPFSNCMAFY